MINSEPDAGNRLEAVARHSEIKASRKHDSPQQPPQKVPSFTTTSEWEQPELGQSSLDTQVAAGARFLEGLNGSEACPDLYPQSMDLDTLVGGMVGELDDSREGSPCRRAATELLLPGSFGADVQPGEAPPPVSSQGYGAPRQDNLAGFPGQAQWMPNSFQQQPPWAPGGPGLWEPDRQRQAWYQQSAQLSQHPDSYSGRQQQTFRSAQQAGFQQHTQQAQAGSSQDDQIVPGGNMGPSLMGCMAPACEGDWLTSIMDQALSVGLWGGSTSPRLGEQSKPQPPSGTPGLQNAIRSKGPAGLQSSCLEPLPSISFYQAEMEAMLPQQCRPKEQGGALEAGVGHISRELQLQPSQPPQEGASKTPRLPPVSLGMTSNSLSDMLACSAKMGMNDGPFRPPTRPPAGKANKVAGSSKFNAPQPSMLQQSRLQLSLGLDAETPIDLRSWGYGEESNTTAPGQGDDSACVSSGLQEDGHMAVDATRTSDSCSVDLSGLMPISSSVSLPAIKIGISLSDSRHNSITLAPKAPGLASPRHIWDNGCVTDGEGRDRLPGSKARRPAAEEAAATRAECLERYREKKRRRLIHKTIRYHKRKVNADNRPRIKGRFVKSADSKQDSGMEVEGTTVDGQPQEEEQAGHDLLGEPVKVPPISGSTLTRA